MTLFKENDTWVKNKKSEQMLMRRATSSV